MGGRQEACCRQNGQLLRKPSLSRSDTSHQGAGPEGSAFCVFDEARRLAAAIVGVSGCDPTAAQVAPTGVIRLQMRRTYDLNDTKK